MAGWPACGGHPARPCRGDFPNRRGAVGHARSCRSARDADRAGMAKLIPMRLELTHRGAYAIRAVLTLAHEGDEHVVPARVIARQMDIPVRFLPQVLGDLTPRGHRGGPAGHGQGAIV